MFTSPGNLPLFPDGVAEPADDPLFHEIRTRGAGYELIAGVDEAGRGPLAGPVVAAAVVLRPGTDLPGIRDSKQMTGKAREAAFPVIQRDALATAIAVVPHRRIDEGNILEATLEAMRRAVLGLPRQPDFLLVDGIQPVPLAIPQRCLKRGDQLSRSISAASVLAKVYRDRIMQAYHRMFPRYGFGRNKGYGTAEHLAALERHGPCRIHRLSFRGVLPEATGSDRPRGRNP